MPAPALTCAYCTAPLSGRQRRFCSDQCKHNEHYHRVKAPREAAGRVVARLGRSCLHCAAPVPTEREANAVYCNATCRIAAKYQRRQVEHKAYRDRTRRGDQWRAINRTYAYRRRARMAATMVCEFTAGQIEQRMSMFSGCWMCGDPWEHVEHVKPLAKGGAHALANLRPACAACNLRKGRTWRGVAHVISLRRVLPSRRGRHLSALAG